MLPEVTQGSPVKVTVAVVSSGPSGFEKVTVACTKLPDEEAGVFHCAVVALVAVSTCPGVWRRAADWRRRKAGWR